MASWGKVICHKMLYNSPLIFNLIGLGKQNVNCTAVEFVMLNPPQGQTCGEYLGRYITSSGGYLTNSDATSGCEFCPVANTDQFLESNFNISYTHGWRDIGIIFAFTLLNVSNLPLLPGLLD
jgi:ATP-binding cassette subfamily G (WHITE) protein 2 (SNQ2)